MLGGLCIIVLKFAVMRSGIYFHSTYSSLVSKCTVFPLIKYLQRNHIPPPLASAFLVVAIMSSLLMVVNMTIEPAAQWIEELLRA